jgi:hypothetical protein
VYGVVVRAGEALCREVYPANVLLPDGTLLRSLAAYVTTARLVVFATDSFGMIGPVWDADLVVPIGASMNSLMAHERIEAITDRGAVWINRDRGCGCGSPLKTMASPWSWSPARGAA